MARDYPHEHEIENLRRRVQVLEDALTQFRRQRVPQPIVPIQLRWAVPTASSGVAWPTGSANVFPIRFLDPDFTATQGLQNFNRTARSTDPTAFALSYRDWVPEGAPLQVLQQRGLGADDAGEWWFLDPPSYYTARLLGSLSAAGSASAEIYLLQTDGTFAASGCTVTVYDDLLVGTETLAANTRVKIVWEPFVEAPSAAPYGRWKPWAASCSAATW